MNEKTVSSIKIWSVIVGILSLSSLWTLSVYPLLSFVGLLSLIAILLGLAVAYAGLQVANLSLSTVNGIFWTKFVWLVLNFLLSLSAGATGFIRLVIIVAQGVIVWYLIQSVKKLHRPAHHAA